MAQLQAIQLVYSTTVPEEHITKMKRSAGVFNNFKIENWLSTPPPANHSEAVQIELNYLSTIRKNKAFVEYADRITQYFADFFEDKPVNFPEKKVESLLSKTRPTILKLKYHYNRPRPLQLAKATGNKIKNGVSLDSMKSPSYPSGHATQGIFIANVLGDIFPEYKKELLQLGQDISMARLVAKAHYPTDNDFGEKLGYELYKHYKKEK